MRWFVGSCVLALVFLTLVNAWWQHQTYSAQLAKLEEQYRATNVELLSRQSEVSAQRVRLGTCRSDVAQLQQQLHQASLHTVDLSRRWATERGTLQAERDALAKDLRTCQARHSSVLAQGARQLQDPQADSRSISHSHSQSLARAHGHRLSKGNQPGSALGSGAAAVVGVGVVAGAEAAQCPELLALAVRELRRLRSIAQERALEAEASTARLLVAGRTMRARARVMQLSLARRMHRLERRMGAAVEMHAKQLAKVAADIGFQPDSEAYFHELTLEKLEEFVAARTKPTGQRRPQGHGFSHRHLRGSAHSRMPSRSRRAEEGNWTQGEGQSCIALVVPFRGRGEHLKLFYEHFGKFFKLPEARNLCWSVFLVEQFDTELFNRGWLFNVGFAMAQADSRKFKCLVIQDLDTLPELGAGVDFSQCKIPTQLSSEIQCYNWLPPYADNTGGVVGMTAEHWHSINGFANSYDGWGGEDDDLRLRLKQLGLLRGTCGSFCNLTHLAFRPGQEELINRPARGRGRFLCLDETSHTPRKHGNMDLMRQKLEEMQMGSDRWTFDGLSNLRFELVHHEVKSFPGAAATGAAMHWVRTVPDLMLRFRPDRLQLLLAEGSCSAECESLGRCLAHPTGVPLSLQDLQVQFARVLGDCLDSNLGSVENLGFWLLDRQVLATPLRSVSLGEGFDAQLSPEALSPAAQASWVLSETLREAFASEVDGRPAVVVRAVPMAQLERVLSHVREDPTRQQLPLVSACVGVYQLDNGLGLKHTVNVGSDDCEQRSWTHLTSFKVLRRRRAKNDIPVCIGEADEVWTARVGPMLEDCSGSALGVVFRHKDVFYIDPHAQGRKMCVRYKLEEGAPQWSRYQIVPAGVSGRCGYRHDGYRTNFTFKSMEDLYQPPRLYLCACNRDNRRRLQLQQDCGPGSSFALAVLRPELARDDSELYCIATSRSSDRVAPGRNCSFAEKDLGLAWSHVATFAVPRNASGPPWCLGRKLLPGNGTGSDGGNGTLSMLPLPAHPQALFRIAARPLCDSAGFTHLLGLREVALAEMTPSAGLLSLRAT